MNERIKELAEQAGLQPFEDCGPGYVYKMEKFAELIVQEMSRLLEQYHSDSFPEDTVDDFDRGVPGWLAHSAKSS